MEDKAVGLISVNKNKLNIFVLLFAFLITWKVYWLIFNWITPENSVTDILAIAGIVIIVVPLSFCVKSILMKFIRK